MGFLGLALVGLRLSFMIIGIPATPAMVAQIDNE